MEISMRPNSVEIVDGFICAKMTRDDVESLLAGMNAARMCQARRQEKQCPAVSREVFVQRVQCSKQRLIIEAVRQTNAAAAGLGRQHD